jgi:transposase-like protein
MQRRSHKNKKYSKELKQQAVKDYLAGKGSQREICKKYEISDTRVLRRWILWYNGHKEFKEPSRAKGEIYMTKGRKTTQEERAEIVAFCIEHGRDYGLTVETYKVSYQQIYSWVRKYDEKGVQGLTDRRGKAKPENELTEADRLRQENKILQARIKDQEMEIAILKKLRELRGGGQ